MSFRFAARYVLLTYAQSGDLDPFRVVDHLATLGAECIIGRELHEDGGVHLHAFAMWPSEFRTRRADAFDVDGKHPNVSPSRGNPQNGFAYAIKDGDICAGGLCIDDIPTGGRPPSAPPSGDLWGSICAAPSRDDFFRLIETHFPRVLITSFVSIQKFADWRYRAEPTPYAHPDSITFSPPDELEMWVSNNLGQTNVGMFISEVWALRAWPRTLAWGCPYHWVSAQSTKRSHLRFAPDHFAPSRSSGILIRYSTR